MENRVDKAAMAAELARLVPNAPARYIDGLILAAERAVEMEAVRADLTPLQMAVWAIVLHAEQTDRVAPVLRSLEAVFSSSEAVWALTDGITRGMLSDDSGDPKKN